MRFLVALGLVAAGAYAKPEMIRGVREPIYHLYLQEYPEDPTRVVLGPEDTADSFEIDGTIQSTNSSMFINISDDDTSYKALSFGEAGEMTGWGLEGDTIITTTASSYGRRKYFKVLGVVLVSDAVTELNFIVCELDAEFWEVFLQTGSDEPSGRTCSNYQTIHLPCLC